MKKVKSRVIESEKDMEEFGEEICKNWRKGEFGERNVFSLEGELGAGKTTFTKGLARGFGIGDIIDSPTFVILKQYGNFYHFDLYRLEEDSELLDLGFLEIVREQDNFVVLEWGDKFEELMNKIGNQIIRIRFKIEEDKRRLFFEAK